MPGLIDVLPDDVHNQTLIGNVHPGDWTNPEPAGRYNLCGLDAMFDEVSRWLQQRGVHFTRIHREVFFHA